jgi:AbrB family looped-hinge helix DNA binding protein
MATATMSSKGQVTIPQEVRRRLKLETGVRVEFVELPDGAFAIQPAIRDVRAIRGLLRRPKMAVTLEEMDAAVRARGAKR